MSDVRYSKLSVYELQQEIAALTEKARKAEQLGMVNEFSVLERKVTMAKAYLLNPDDFKKVKYIKLKAIPVSISKLII